MQSASTLLSMVFSNGAEILWTITGVAGALMLAIKNRFSPWAWPVWMFSNIAGIVWALSTDSFGALVQQVVFLVINIIGTNKWLVAARREKAHASEVALFSDPPVLSQRTTALSQAIDSEALARVRDRIFSSLSAKTSH